MTPIADQMKFHLDQRRRWFHNEWFFKWHHIGSEDGVEIDTFDGRHARYGGIEYSGTPVQIFWDAVVRGVRKEITEQFGWLDEQVRRYNPETANRSISECAGLLVAFAEGVRRDAIEKDRVLRGRNGIPAPTGADSGHWDGLSRGEILARGEALRASLPRAAPDSSVEATDIASWTEPQRGAVLTEEQRRGLLVAIEDSHRALDQLRLPNSQRAQVLAYIGAAKELAEAPEPPADVIWQLIGRAADILGIVGFFAAVLAVFH